MQDNLSEAIRAAEEKIRYDGYTMLGQDAENCDLGYTEAAQGEVMLRGRLPVRLDCMISQEA